MRRPKIIKKNVQDTSATKRFDGELYKLYRSSEYRGVAMSIAALCRRQGQQARVVKMSPSYIWSTGKFYGVYVR